MAKYDPAKELKVLWIIKEIGLVSIEEISDRYRELFHETYADVNLVVRRWKARGALSIEDGRYKLADVPPWFQSLKQAQLIHLSKTESQNMWKDLETIFVGEQTAIPKSGAWGHFQKFTFEFEALDPILGGIVTDEGNRLAFPRDGDLLVVPKSWLRGFIRDNQSIFDVQGLQNHVAWGKGVFDKDTKTIALKATVSSRGKGIGIVNYEAVPKGSRFTVPVMWPMRGCSINSVLKIQDSFDILAETSIRGLGANPNAYGGRIKLLKVA
jgi:hypothetical protein